jgi:tRNA pseudouridine55 synthase
MIKINGWVVLDKPLGMSSAHAVAKIKRLFKATKAGHGGTLDPLATGVLPIALGEATKTLSYVLEGKKAYRFEVKWGEARSTEDQEGEVIATSEYRPTRLEIEEILPKFTGVIEQIPPIYSALKVKGERAYALARQGKDVKLAPRTITIDKLTLLHVYLESAVFEVECSKGTYVRSLARDLAMSLGTCGYLMSLRRLMVSPFSEKDAILLDSLLNIGHNTELMKYVLPIQDALVDILALEVEEAEAVKLRQGQTVYSSHKEEGEAVLILCRGVPQALAKARNGVMTPLRVFNIE